MRRLLWIIAFSAVILLITSTSEAQRNGKRRNPIRNQRPSISPYANLFRGDNGGLNSLYGFYIPRARTLEFANQTTRELQAQRSLLSEDTVKLQREIQSLYKTDTEASPQNRPMLQMRPSGSAVRRRAGAFQNHSSFFPGFGQ